MSDDDIHKMMERAHYAEIREARLRIAYGDLKAENERLRKALQELVALVRGECPRLLDEDRDGDARLSIEIDAALEAKS